MRAFLWFTSSLAAQVGVMALVWYCFDNRPALGISALVLYFDYKAYVLGAVVQHEHKASDRSRWLDTLTLRFGIVALLQRAKAGADMVVWRDATVSAAADINDHDRSTALLSSENRGSSILLTAILGAAGHIAVSAVGAFIGIGARSIPFPLIG